MVADRRCGLHSFSLDEKYISTTCKNGARPTVQQTLKNRSRTQNQQQIRPIRFKPPPRYPILPFTERSKAMNFGTLKPHKWTNLSLFPPNFQLLEVRYFRCGGNHLCADTTLVELPYLKYGVPTQANVGTFFQAGSVSQREKSLLLAFRIVVVDSVHNLVNNS